MKTIEEILTILPELKRDLDDLITTGRTKEAMRLTKEYSEFLGQPFYFAHHGIPHYPINNFDAPTVFAHLNPGSGLGEISSMESFSAQTCGDYLMTKYGLNKDSNISEYIEKYVYFTEWYARNRFDRDNERDNFDYKQACFLKGFPENGIDLKDGHDHDVQKHNSINVIDQKLQLELFPYSSNKIDTYALSKILNKKPELLTPYINRLLDIIALYPHKYILFGSRIYDTILKVYNQDVEKIIEYISPEQKFEGITKNILAFTFIRLKWKNKIMDAGIAHSFPRRDLPNAYEKMEKYGKLCADFYISEQDKLNK